MRIPQLFIKLGKGYIPVEKPVQNKVLYYWDDTTQRIQPAKGHLSLYHVSGLPILAGSSPRDRTVV